MLLRKPLRALEAGFGEHFDVDGEAAPQLVEQHRHQFPAVFRRVLAQRLHRADPPVLGRRQPVQVGIVDAQQPGLLQVGHRDPPAADQVAVEPEAHHLAERLVRGLAQRRRWIDRNGVLAEVEPELVDHRLGHGLVREAARAGVGGSVVQRAPKQGNQNEVVEVTGLQRGVLAVVDEGQQLPRRRRQLGVGDGAQAADHAGSDHRHGRGTPFGRQRSQLGELVAAQVLVGHPAAQAETERTGHVGGA